MEKIIYYGTKGAWGHPSVSPFCSKVETFFRMANIPYGFKSFNPMQAPRGKMPYIAYNGRLLPDSSEIIAALCKGQNIDLIGHLSAEQQQIGHAVCRMLEEGSYFIIFHDRWLNDKNWQLNKNIYFSDMPPVVKQLVPTLLRKKVRKTLKSHGISNIPREQRAAILTADLEVVARQLGDQPYLFGNQPSIYDCTAFAFIISCTAPLPDPIIRLTDKKLLQYCSRMLKQYFPEFSAEFSESSADLVRKKGS